MMRVALEDVDIAGAVIRRGERGSTDFRESGVQTGNQFARIDEQGRQDLAGHALQAKREQIFRGRVGVDDAQFVVNENYRGGEQIEAVKSAGNHVGSERPVCNGVG